MSAAKRFLLLIREPRLPPSFRESSIGRASSLNEPIGALAHLGLARSYAMQGHTAKAKAAYQDFLTLWKDADPNIPVLIAAKLEYAS